MIDIETRTNPALAAAAAEVLQRLAGRHLISNALVPAIAGQTLDVRDPATGRLIAVAPAAGAADVATAVRAAADAYPGRAATPARQRGRLFAFNLGATRTMFSPRPTTAISAWPRRSGPTTYAPRCVRRSGSTPATSKSTRA